MGISWFGRPPKGPISTSRVPPFRTPQMMPVGTPPALTSRRSLATASALGRSEPTVLQCVRKVTTMTAGSEPRTAERIVATASLSSKRIMQRRCSWGALEAMRFRAGFTLTSRFRFICFWLRLHARHARDRLLWEEQQNSPVGRIIVRALYCLGVPSARPIRNQSAGVGNVAA